MLLRPSPWPDRRKGPEGVFLHTVHGSHTVSSLPATPGLCLLGKEGTALRTPQTRGQPAAEPRVSSFTDKVHGFPGRPPWLGVCPRSSCSETCPPRCWEVSGHGPWRFEGRAQADGIGALAKETPKGPFTAVTGHPSGHHETSGTQRRVLSPTSDLQAPGL